MSKHWRAPTLATPSSAENRRATRRSVMMTAQLRDRGATRFKVSVIDLSTSGFRCETPMDLQAGSTVWLTMPGMAGLEAVVAWSDGRFYGCAFRNQLHPAVFEHLVRLMGAR